MDSPLALTVVICTWQRPAAVRQLLLNLEEQRPGPGEVLVVEGDPTRRGDCAAADCPVCTLPLRNRPRHHFTRPGLEHQRNVGADLGGMPIICFLDDDVLLEPGCLARLSQVFESDRDGKVGGISGYMTNRSLAARIPARWRLRRALGVVPALVPGRYTRSGNSIPLEFAAPFTGCRPVDFLVGYCMAYRRHVLQEFRFGTDMYLGEDLHYSLRVGQRYLLYHCGDARLQHLHDPAARVSHRRYGFMSVYNHFRIHRDCLSHRGLGDVCLFWYSMAFDLTLLCGRYLFGADRRSTADHLVGRLQAIATLARHGCRLAPQDALQRAFPRGVSPK